MARIGVMKKSRFVLWLALFSMACSGSLADGNDGGDVQPDGDADGDIDVDADADGDEDLGGFDDTGLRPQGRIAEIWEELGGADENLGYPLAEPLGDVHCAWQLFEQGWMIWVEARTVREGCREFCDQARIFSVICPDGNYEAVHGEHHSRHPDTWAEGQQLFACDEANREEVLLEEYGWTAPIGPVRGFGRVWCEHESVREGLNTASDPERGGEAFDLCESQLFQGGLVLHNPNAEHACYWVFLELTGEWHRFPE